VIAAIATKKTSVASSYNWQWKRPKSALVLCGVDVSLGNAKSSLYRAFGG
jgi:hypothetical protein